MSQMEADTLTGQGNDLFQSQRYPEAVACFERATAIFPSHELAWKGLGHALYCLNRFVDAARAFDRAVGLRPNSATALWGGALAHAEAGNRVMAKNYLMRTLELQPTWIEMVPKAPALAGFVQYSSYVRELLRSVFGSFNGLEVRHATNTTASVEIARFINSPTAAYSTYCSLGLSNQTWPDPRQPRIELLLAVRDGSYAAACGQILGNATFHCMQERFFPNPGSIIRDLISVLGVAELSAKFPHAYFISPTAWRIKLPIDRGPPVTTLLQLVLVTDREYQFWRDNGQSAFDALVEAKEVDFGDLRRDSAI
jgi:Suppressor of fused protein (SUFU)/Tetratricopeptide repeat